MRSNRARLLFVVGSLAALVSLRAVSSPSGSGKDPATRALSIFSDVFSLTRQNYVEPTDGKMLLDGAYDGMSDALDPFSYYVSATDRATYRAQEASGAVGPGIVVARRGGFPYVVGPIAGSPAQKAGVHPGDLIDTVDGKPVRNAPLWKVKAALEGPEGSHIEVILFRGGDEKKVSLSISRARFEPPALSTRWEHDILVVVIPAFTRATSEALRQAMRRPTAGGSPGSSSICGERSAATRRRRCHRRLSSWERGSWRAAFLAVSRWPRSNPPASACGKAAP